MLQDMSCRRLQRTAAGAVLEGNSSWDTRTLAQIGACGKCPANAERDLHRAAKRLHPGMADFVTPSELRVEHAVIIQMCVGNCCTAAPLQVGSMNSTLIGLPS